MEKTFCSRREFISAMLLVPSIGPLTLSKKPGTDKDIKALKGSLIKDTNRNMEHLKAGRYIASMRVYANSYDTETFIVWKVYQSNGKLLLEKADKPSVLDKGYNEVYSVFEIPKIYLKGMESKQIFVLAESVFRNTGEGVSVEQLQIEVNV